MTLRSDSSQLRLSSVDDYLGPGETRFFSAGYRRVEYRLRDVAVTAHGAEALATLTYPRDWSRKAANTDLRPHLSTIDSLVLGMQLAECYLGHARGLDERQRNSSILRRVLLRAGTTPQEDLEAVRLSARLRDTTPVPERSGRFLSSFDCTAGLMRARCLIEHDEGILTTQEGSYRSLQDLLGPAASRYYGDGFKTRQQTVEHIVLDLDALSAEATVGVQQLPGTVAPKSGVDGDRQPLVTPVDCFVVTLQLAQILMYEMDNLRRQDSKTLWMLQCALDATAPVTAGPGLSANATITGNHLLNVRDAHWRNVDITGACGGIGLRCSFAHELPA
jgi:hypothetical protein